MGDRRSGRLKSITYECAFHPSVCSPTNGCGCWQLAFSYRGGISSSSGSRFLLYVIVLQIVAATLASFVWQFPKAFYINIKLWRLFVVTNNLIPIEYYYLQKSVVQSSWLLLEEALAEAARLLCRITGDLRLSGCFPRVPVSGPKKCLLFS